MCLIHFYVVPARLYNFIVELLFPSAAVSPSLFFFSYREFTHIVRAANSRCIVGSSASCRMCETYGIAYTIKSSVVCPHALSFRQCVRTQLSRQEIILMWTNNLFRHCIRTLENLVVEVDMFVWVLGTKLVTLTIQY